MSFDLDAFDRVMADRYERHRPFLVDLPEGQSGEWRVSKFTVERDIQSLRLAFEGRACPHGDYTRLAGPEGLFMSDTPAEMEDLRPFLRCASGAVIIGGLGLGMMLKPLLAKESVAHVTVLEKSPDVMALVAPHYSDPRLRIINADVFEWKPDRVFSWAWWDIWPDICEDNRPEFGRIRRRYARFMEAPERQFCWGEPQLNRERAQERRRGAWW